MLRKGSRGSKVKGVKWIIEGMHMRVRFGLDKSKEGGEDCK
jgi:hypothetical protein